MTSTSSVEDVVDAADGWHLFGTECPKEEIVFSCQVIILYTVIVVSIYNLTVGHGDSPLWTALLSSSLGYLLPNPSLKREMASEFYLVLPSNSSMVTHPNNTLAQYITNLPRRMSLSGVWECGLTEIHYPHDWYNVRNARLTVEHDGNMETDAYFEDSYYDSPKALAKKLNGDKPGRVKISYEPVTQKFGANMKSETTVTLYGDQPDILGFGAGTGDSSSTSLASSTLSMVVRGYSIVDLRHGFESLYVYSNIVEPRIVGDKIAPLLRIVPITGSHGEMVMSRFDHVQYIPVLSREFGCVETEIRDDTGRPVPFERWKVTVTLHFRRSSSGLFR